MIGEEDLEGLPSPVARSLQHSGVVGSPVPTKVSVTQTGMIRSADDRPWMKFKAEETYEVARPGFVWTAGLKVAGLPLGRAVDSLEAGRGRMHVRLLGLVDLIDASGPEMDQGALLRWLNETMWFPQVWTTALVMWEPVDERSAVARLESAGLTVTAEFRFDEVGRVVDFVADRYRDVDRRFVLTTWSTPISEYDMFEGMELPSAGSGVWDLGDQHFEYIRLRIDSVTHQGRT